MREAPEYERQRHRRRSQGIFRRRSGAEGGGQRQYDEPVRRLTRAWRGGFRCPPRLPTWRGAPCTNRLAPPELSWGGKPARRKSADLRRSEERRGGKEWVRRVKS